MLALPPPLFPPSSLWYVHLLSLSLQTLTGADELQSMIVMSYWSPWEKKGQSEVRKKHRDGGGGWKPEGTDIDTHAKGYGCRGKENKRTK